MPAIPPLIFPLLAQIQPIAPPPPPPPQEPLARWQFWLLQLGEPTFTMAGVLGSVLVWMKVVGLICLLCWIATRLTAAIRKRSATAWLGPLDWVGLLAVLGLVGSVAVRFLQLGQRIPELDFWEVMPAAVLVGLICAGLIVLWVDLIVWGSVLQAARRGGEAAARDQGTRLDLVILIALHAALALGLGVGFLLNSNTVWQLLLFLGIQSPTSSKVLDTLVLGLRFGCTFMGYVALLYVLARLMSEVFALRVRRLYAIAWHTVVEANRRMWAPWVLIVIFGVVLAFTHWFLRPTGGPEIARQAELGRLFVGALALMCSLLLTAMITILVPLSLPTDIQSQTIYTVVSKPVRRLEMIWGRILGFMALVTVLLALFGAISLVYLDRVVGGSIAEVEAAARKARAENRPDRARVLDEQAEQMRSRMSARVPIKGSLVFLDPKGELSLKGINVGTEMEYRSHIAGATQARAIWRFGLVPDLRFPKGAPLERLIPVDDLLPAGTIEGEANRIEELKYERSRIEARQRQASLAGSTDLRRLNQLGSEIDQATRELEGMKAREANLQNRAEEARQADRPEEAEDLAAEARQLHAPEVPLEMTFNVYRTTKGVPGEPVLASLKATNPFSDRRPYSDTFPIHEYYTDRHSLPSSLLVGCRGYLTIEVLCISPTQYLGMAESDLYILQRNNSFRLNYLKGLAGIWFQALVLTAVGVCAGTFLSWPVALLMTFAFFLAGQAAFSVLQQFATQSLLGGGPFESVIRMITHDAQITPLAPSLGVILAKTLDAIVQPIMGRMVYIVPNLSALDLSNTVADGFNVGWDQLGQGLLLALGYALPFSVAGYFILKNREVAA